MKNKKRRRGGIDSVIITLILILVVMISIPLFKVFANSNAKTSNMAEKNSKNVINQSHTFMNNNIQGSFDTPFSN